MANLKNITDLPVAESAEGLNLIVNDNGSAKQITLEAVKTQQDYDLVFEYNEDITLSLSLSVDSLKEVPVEKFAQTIQKITNGQDVKILFKYKYYESWNDNNDYNYHFAEQNMSIFAAGSGGSTSVCAAVAIPIWVEGFSMMSITITFNENGVQSIECGTL